MHMEVYMDTIFGARIRMLRIEKNMTQAQLGNRLGVSKSMISAYESDMRKPSPDVLAQMGLLFGVSMDFLFHNEPKHRTFSGMDTLTPSQLHAVRIIIDEMQRKNHLEEISADPDIRS